MVYQKIINLLDDTTNQPSKFRTQNWVEINDESRATYNDDDSNNIDDVNNIKFKTLMIRSSLCDCSDAYILVKQTIKFPNMAAAGASVNNTNKTVILQSSAPFTSCINEINNTQVDNPQDIDIVMPMHNLIEYSNAYLKTSGSLCQYYTDEPALDNNGNILDFSANGNKSSSFNFKQQITEETGKEGPKDVEIIVPLKYLNNTWRILEMSLINCKISLQLTCSKKVF